MDIVGGTYYELCSFPEWSGIFGSGGRAAAALSAFGDIQFHTFAPAEYEDEFRVALAPYDFPITFYPSDFVYDFHYVHSLSKPVFYTLPAAQAQQGMPFIFLTADVCLRFGFMEGSAVINGKWVTYDPQSPSPEKFSSNGSSAQHLAYVLNEHELLAMYPGMDMDAAGRLLIRDEAAEVILVKRGVFGVRVISAQGDTGSVPAYQTANVFKIGSGDVFSAAFAYQWGQLHKDPFTSARIASQSAAWYCDTRSLPLPDQDLLDTLTPVTGGNPRQIYLAGPFFTVSQRLLIEEVRNILYKLGAKVFSPFHDIGLGDPKVVAPADAAAIKESALILAVADDVDLGTNFEIGYGAAYGIKAIVQALQLQEYHFSMVIGTGGSVERDFATALYKAVWASLI